MDSLGKLKQMKQGFLRTKGYVAELFLAAAEVIEEMGQRIGGVERKVDAMTPKVEEEGLIFEEGKGGEVNGT